MNLNWSGKKLNFCMLPQGVDDVPEIHSAQEVVKNRPSSKSLTEVIWIDQECPYTFFGTVSHVRNLIQPNELEQGVVMAATY